MDLSYKYQKKLSAHSTFIMSDWKTMRRGQG